MILAADTIVGAVVKRQKINCPSWRQTARLITKTTARVALRRRIYVSCIPMANLRMITRSLMIILSNHKSDEEVDSNGDDNSKGHDHKNQRECHYYLRINP